MERVWKFSEDRKTVERECLLFEAGHYPDKGVTVTEADLGEIARNSMAEIPVKIEHLLESPLDRILGVVTGLRAVGSQLWGTLRQSKDAWDLMQRAGVRALSVGLDMEGRRIVETSLVCRPRVANAQVFCQSGADTEAEKAGRLVRFTPSLEKGEVAKMLEGVRQAAEGLRESLRRLLNDVDEAEPTAATETALAEFSLERAQLARDRRTFQEERIGQKLRDWKRAGLLRGTEAAETSAKALLLAEETQRVTFGAEKTSVSELFSRFVEANGTVIPMGERIGASMGQSGGGIGARARLMELAEARAKAEGISFSTAFSAEATAHPDLAQRAREE